MKFDARGREVHDATPIARTVGLQRPPTLQEQIKRFVRTELSRQAEEQGTETFEEADDFDVGDDFDPQSPWELTADQEEAQADLFRQQATPPAPPPPAGPVEPATPPAGLSPSPPPSSPG